MLNANQVNFSDRTVRGTVRRVTFRNEQNGYFVARISIPGVREEFTIVGVTPSINEGEVLEAKGCWEISQYGRRFKAQTVTLSAPVDEVGLVRYLAAAFKGIGPTYAARLVEAFGSKVGEVISEAPHRLSEVPGIGKKKAHAIIEAWASRSEGENLLPWLCGLGLSPTYAKRVCARFGSRTRKLVSENPYELANAIRGIGFVKADAIARKLGLSESNPYRVQAAVLRVLNTAKNAGSCGLPRKQLIFGTERHGTLAGALELLGFTADAERVRLVEDAIDALVKRQIIACEVVHDEPCVFLREIYDAERRIAQKLLGLMQAPALALGDLDSAISKTEFDQAIVLEATQRVAVATALREKVFALVGGPGTGKTTITRVIVSILESHGQKVIVCAPTGKAAKRASEAIGVPAATVHRILEWKFSRPSYNEQRLLDCDTVVLDEMSMVDVFLFKALLEALPPHAKLILIGDADQLPSVGPGRVLTDLITSGRIPTVRLTEVFRQAQQSQIIRNAHLINQGYAPAVGWEDGSDFGFFHHETAQEAQDALLLAARDIWKRGFHPVHDVQVLCPMRKGKLGVDELNGELQRILNPTPAVDMPFQGARLGIGDKVIQIRNNYAKAVFNGEIGYVTDIFPDTRTVVVNFDGYTAQYDASELDEIRLAYALSIHRSQGSEFPVVLMGLHKNHFMMLKRNLLYTGSTRARQLLLIYGNIGAASIAVKRCQIEERFSKLRDWLIGPAPVQTTREAA